MVQKITPNIWCNGNAQEMVDFYTEAFGDVAVIHTEYYPNTVAEGLADFQLALAGKVLSVQFRIYDLEFVAINGGSEFEPNPSISFFVNFDPSRDDKAREHLDELWQKLGDSGKVRMELDEYPFSPHYGWLEDKFGVNWQLILADPDGDPRPMIMPSLLFTGRVQDQARAAIEHYVSLFDDTEIGTIYPYGEPTGPAKANALAFGEFRVGDQWIVAMDSGGDVQHEFTFSEGVSLAISCRDQAEIDKLWSALSTVPEAEQCGWCKDQFGVSWQIVPENMNQLMATPDAFKIMMQQHKIVIDEYNQ